MATVVVRGFESGGDRPTGEQVGITKGTTMAQKRFRVTEDDLYDGTNGICVECGEIASGVEPDASRYRCESCDANAVYGCEEALMQGLVDLDTGDDDEDSDDLIDDTGDGDDRDPADDGSAIPGDENDDTDDGRSTD